MTIIPGSGYEAYKELLREKIRNNSIISLELEHGYSEKTQDCYFCRRPIQGKIRLLINKDPINKIESEDKRVIHESCYQQAKLFFYYKNFQFSLN